MPTLSMPYLYPQTSSVGLDKMSEIPDTRDNMQIDDLIAAKFEGSSRKAREALGVTRQTISHWRKHGIPAMRRFQIEAVVREREAPKQDA